MNGNSLFHGDYAQTVISNFTAYVKTNGGDFTKWFIGVTFDSFNNEEIKKQYELKHNTIMNFMIDNSDVLEVFDYFQQKGMKSKMKNNQKFKNKDKKAGITNSTIFIYKLL